MVDVFWIIPSNLLLKDTLESAPPSFRYHIDYFYHIIDSICKASEWEDLDNNAAFVNLNAKRMQAFNHDYKRYIAYLLTIGVIVSDKTWIIGRKSTGYKLNPMLGFAGDMARVRITKSVCRKKMFAEAKEQVKRANSDFPILTKWFNNHLHMDVEGARAKVNELFPSPTGGIRGPLRYWRGKRNRPDSGSKRLKALYSIHRFANKDFYFHIDDNVGRFHSNLTNIKRELRHYITYDGKRLVNIDIKSAQPLFSTLLLSQRFYEKSSATISLSQFPSIIADLNVSTTKHPAVTLYIMLVKLLQVVEYECFKGYVEMVNSGKFYDLLSQVMYPGKLVKKEDIKIEVYRVFFSKNRSQNPFKTMFKKQFPKVYQVFALYKRAKHTCLSRLLQSIESKLMIQSVSMRIAREKPDLPIFTIHDSIATTIGNEDYVQEVIKQEALTLTGLKVKLGLEYWG
jgi:hypothetical protein